MGVKRDVDAVGTLCCEGFELQLLHERHRPEPQNFTLRSTLFTLFL